MAGGAGKGKGGRQSTFCLDNLINIMWLL